ncbi:MAG TPA: energy transducer TonB [Bacteroidales bacterium]|nr:energy transducer TonB [Bacteroidales bacterium]
MSEKIKTTNIDEITFEKRNKEYGAYYIRKRYNRYLSRAIFIGIFAVAGATIIPFLIFKEASSVNIEKEVGAEFANLEAPKTEEAPPPPPPPPPEAVEQKVKFTAPVVTTDTVEETGMLNQDDLNQQSTNTAPVEVEDFVVVEEEVVQVIEQEAPPLTFVELMPTYVGGEEALYAFLGANIKYPTIARENNISGTVIVNFVVERDGSISNVKVIKDIGGGCGEEALRVVKTMPKWNVGKQNGSPVRVFFNLPVKFTLSN